MKKVIIIQPGKMGDLILMMPIAKFYNELGYKVDFPTFSNFKNFFANIDYVNHIDFNIYLDETEYHNSTRMKMWDIGKSFEEQILNPFPLDGFSKSIQFFEKLYNYISINSYDIVLDPCWGFAGHIRQEKTNIVIDECIKNNKSWIEAKYNLCDVDLSERWKFSWTRQEEKENELLEFITNFSLKKYGSKEYSIIHSYKSDNLPSYDVINPINFTYVEGYEIYHWIKVLENSKNIVCIDSCLSHFVETQEMLRQIPKIYLGSEEKHWSPFMRNILKNNWINLSKAKID